MLTILTSILALWALVIVLVLALCASARRGDADGRANPTRRAWEPSLPDWEPVASLPTSPHPGRAGAPPRRAAIWTRHAETPAHVARAGGAVG
ncbi:MAG TPA: hypothetical protein VHT27_07505 [Solirubrobacteraceae bacterium]|jgi:hypothetical protein|nr:hypothetical protein [Solirubrobacteraceae bacterium]